MPIAPSSPEREERDLEQEFQELLRRSRDSGYTGFQHLVREMDDIEEQRDVDLSILDFCSYKALEAIFEWRRRPDHHESDLPDVLVNMTNDWLTFMSHKHGRTTEGYLNPQAQFRTRLLQFCLVFTHRLRAGQTWTSPDSLANLRAENEKRHAYWKERRDEDMDGMRETEYDSPLDEVTIHSNRNKMASDLGMPSHKREWTRDFNGTPTLQDLLPLFIDLVLARQSLGGRRIQRDFLKLLIEWMTQAVIEAYLCCGASGDDAFESIFSVGCPGVSQSLHREPEWVQDMHKLFCEGPRHNGVHGWEKMKHVATVTILPEMSSQGSTTWIQNLEQAREGHPIEAFEDKVLSFLLTLHNSIDKPDLVQVERGEIMVNGQRLSSDETREFLHRVGC